MMDWFNDLSLIEFLLIWITFVLTSQWWNQQKAHTVMVDYLHEIDKNVSQIENDGKLNR